MGAVEVWVRDSLTTGCLPINGILLNRRINELGQPVAKLSY